MKFKFLLVFLIMLNLKNTLLANETVNLYDFSFEDIDGNQVNLEKFDGKPILIVNTASRCGFTPQYADLQNLFLNYKNSDLTIIATTSNSFNQEYLDNEDIKQICLVNLIQTSWWRKTKNISLVKKIENLKYLLKQNVQPRLVWEITFLKILMEDI